MVSEVSGNGSDSSDTISPIHPDKFAVTDTSETFMSIARENWLCRKTDNLTGNVHGITRWMKSPH